MWWNQKSFLDEDLLDPYPTLNVSFPSESYPALTIPFPAIMCPNKLAANVSNSILRNPPFCYFASFLIVLLTPSNNSPESSRDLTILKISSISSIEIIGVIVTERCIFF